MRLTQWGRVLQICISKLTIISSDNGLLPGWCQAIIWTNAGILLIRNKLHWNFNQTSYIFIHKNPFENVIWKMAAICLGPNVLNNLISVSVFSHSRSRKYRSGPRNSHLSLVTEPIKPQLLPYPLKTMKDGSYFKNRYHLISIENPILEIMSL